MLQGYYDDSADDKAATVFAVGGFIAEREAWDAQFRPAWGNFLRREGLQYFRMSEAVRHKGPYAKWAGQYGIDRLAELVAIIRRTASVAITFTVRMDDFRAYKDCLDQALGQSVAPFHLCAGVALQSIRKKWQSGHPDRQSLEHIFESGTKGTGDVLETLREMATKWPDDFASPEGGNFQHKREALPLQAADMMAYETMKAEKEKSQIREFSEHRKIAREILAAPMEILQGSIGAAHMQELLDAHARMAD